MISNFIKLQPDTTSFILTRQAKQTMAYISYNMCQVWKHFNKNTWMSKPRTPSQDLRRTTRKKTIKVTWKSRTSQIFKNKQEHLIKCKPKIHCRLICCYWGVREKLPKTTKFGRRNAVELMNIANQNLHAVSKDQCWKFTDHSRKLWGGKSQSW